jgi:hypothetical protein
VDSEFVLDQPMCAGRDSLTGLRNGVPSSVALADVTAVAMRETNMTVIVGISLVVVALAGPVPAQLGAESLAGLPSVEAHLRVS